MNAHGPDTPSAAHPNLYELVPGQLPRLIVSKCSACAAIAFPRLLLGCEVCGHADLDAIQVPASGIVHSFADVHRYHRNDLATPFTVIEVLLDDGPLVRALFECDGDLGLIGRRVVAQWYPHTVDDDNVVEPRFVLDRAESATP